MDLQVKKQVFDLQSWQPPAPFRERFPWIGGDLQTLRNYILRHSADLSPWPSRRLEIEMGDGSGDRLIAELHANALHEGGEGADQRPLALLIHGLTGCADSAYIRNTARVLLEAGFAVVRMNLRGAGPGAAASRFHYHAGRSEDLRDFLVGLSKQEPALCARGLVLTGYSLGANMMLKFLAEYGGDFPLQAAVSVSAPLDLKATQVRMMAPRNRLYQNYLLKRMKAETSVEVLEQIGMTREALQALENIYQYDDRIVAPANGFEGAEDYYRRCSSGPFLEAIGVPTLLIHAKNDPWIPGKTYAPALETQSSRVRTLLLEKGGHVGFHGREDGAAWHDICVRMIFLQAVL
ncbi:YheT family hydrolase [Pelagibius sp. Alg239-R121]|uniref:YheT family hydrolase n=1 Tax=Pelagibius sp. Alg239-R121 TaxID=2993448 RepID=UPI0024A66DA6|nr:alpha/beta fold hydrolase [Pelagibius sp. Alg239-R121]